MNLTVEECGDNKRVFGIPLYPLPIPLRPLPIQLRPLPIPLGPLPMNEIISNTNSRQNDDNNAFSKVRWNETVVRWRKNEVTMMKMQISLHFHYHVFVYSRFRVLEHRHFVSTQLNCRDIDYLPKHCFPRILFSGYQVPMF